LADLDRGGREDQRLGDLEAREAAREERGDLTLAGGDAERLQADGGRAGRAGVFDHDRHATIKSRTRTGCVEGHPTILGGTVTTFAPARALGARY
jgi:hypothetical protein